MENKKLQTKKTFLDEVGKKVKMSSKDVEAVYNAIADTIGETMLNFDKFIMYGVGTFKKSTIKERKTIHVKTKKPVTYPASTTVRFKVSKKLKDSLNNK